MALKSKTRLFTSYEEPTTNTEGYYHIYAYTIEQGYRTIPHDFYLCDLKVSKENMPLATDFSMMENLTYVNGEKTPFMNKVCPKCKKILEDRFPLNQ